MWCLHILYRPNVHAYLHHSLAHWQYQLTKCIVLLGLGDMFPHNIRTSFSWLCFVNGGLHGPEPIKVASSHTEKFMFWGPRWHCSLKSKGRPCQHTNVQRTLGGNVLGTFLWKVFLMFSECLCSLFAHKHQGIFEEYLTSNYPFLPPIYADHL